MNRPEWSDPRRADLDLCVAQAINGMRVASEVFTERGIDPNPSSPSR